MKKQPQKTAPFVLDLEQTFRWPVLVRVPSLTNVGQKVAQKLTAEWRFIGEDRRKALLDEFRNQLDTIKELSARQNEPGVDAEELKRDIEDATESVQSLGRRMVQEQLVALHGIVDGTGAEIPSSAALIDTALKHPMLFPALQKSLELALAQQDSAGN